MISPELLELLRCPLDPSNTRLEDTEEGARCQRCHVVYPMRDGILCMRVEEAKLPPGCASIGQLPCQVKGA